MNTTSTVVLFSLSGFNATASYRHTLFSLTLLCYCLILLVNVALILTIVLHQSFCWLVPLWCMLLVVGLTSALTLCGSHIDKLYCENWSIVKLSCGSTKANDIVGLIVIAFYLVHVLFIACSYVQLIKSALNSKEGRGKFMQTCMPHLMCLFNVTTALLFDLMYTRYGSSSVPQSLRNFMAVQFLIFPPILNPVIYGLILTKIRRMLIHLCAVACQRFKLRSVV